MVEDATNDACEGDFTEVLMEDDEKYPYNFFFLIRIYIRIPLNLILYGYLQKQG